MRTICPRSSFPVDSVSSFYLLAFLTCIEHEGRERQARSYRELGHNVDELAAEPREAEVHQLEGNMRSDQQSQKLTPQEMLIAHRMQASMNEFTKIDPCMTSRLKRRL